MPLRQIPYNFRSGHGVGNEAYMVRRRWDYFVRYLWGAEPPAGYELKPPAGGGRGGATPPQ